MSAFRAAKPQPGDRLAVIGIGGLSHLALQVAKAMGHEVVAITNSPDKQHDAKAMGADEVLVIKEHVGRELAKMGGVDAVLSFSPSMKQNSQALEGLRPGWAHSAFVTYERSQILQRRRTVVRVRMSSTFWSRLAGVCFASTTTSCYISISRKEAIASTSQPHRRTAL